MRLSIALTAVLSVLPIAGQVGIAPDQVARIHDQIYPVYLAQYWVAPVLDPAGAAVPDPGRPGCAMCAAIGVLPPRSPRQLVHPCQVRNYGAWLDQNGTLRVYQTSVRILPAAAAAVVAVELRGTHLVIIVKPDAAGLAPWEAAAVDLRSGGAVRSLGIEAAPAAWSNALVTVRWPWDPQAGSWAPRPAYVMPCVSPARACPELTAAVSPACCR
jgi:hypothetical protein